MATERESLDYSGLPKGTKWSNTKVTSFRFKLAFLWLISKLRKKWNAPRIKVMETALLLAATLEGLKVPGVPEEIEVKSTAIRKAITRWKETVRCR